MAPVFRFRVVQARFYPNGQYDYCSPANGGNCTEETVTCPPRPASSYNNSTRPTLLSATESRSTRFSGIASKLALPQSAATAPRQSAEMSRGVKTDADCTSETLGNTGLPDKCQTGSCGPDKLCVWSPVSCGPPATGPNQPEHACDPAYGCFELNELGAGAVNRTFSLVAVAVRMEV